jgi:RNA polymerase sigma-70 factor (family 1)
MTSDYGARSDQELADLLKTGDKNAFSEIYSRYKFIMHNHAWNKLRNTQETQDMVQEVFSMLWAKRETVNIGLNLSGFLYTCIHNQFLNMVVHKKVRTKYIDSIAQYSDHAPAFTDHLVRENLLKQIIEKEISQLPPRMKEVFELSRKQHLTHKQIAEIMGISEETVKKQMTYALKILRNKLGIVLYILAYLIDRRW